MATPATPLVVTFGAFIPDTLRQMQQQFAMPLRASVILTSAQILGMFANPVTLVPAPGSGLLLFPLFAMCETTPGTVNYANGGLVNIGNVNATFFQFAAATITNASASFHSNNPGSFLTSTQNLNNSPLQITNSTGAFTAGNGTARVTVYYTVEPTS